MRAARKGDAKAQACIFGLMLQEGLGVPQNYKKAKKWYEKAAMQNRADAQTFLGMLYSQGNGVKRISPPAKKWFEKAAEQDFAPAQTLVGLMYAKGVGTQRNMTQAERWLGAAIQGETDAQTFLGILSVDKTNCTRTSTGQSIVSGRLCEEGDANAQAALGMMYFSARA